jgi:hypothetical protein
MKSSKRKQQTKITKSPERFASGGETHQTGKPGDEVMDAQRHCKAVGWAGIPELAGKAGIKEAEGMVPLGTKNSTKDFIKAARIGRFWDREEDKT